jgi:hypothetical protein
VVDRHVVVVVPPTATGALAFTVADVETAAEGLVVTGTSSNTTLVPIGSVSLGGSDGSRTVVVTPGANQFGDTTITILVNDGTASMSTQFLVTVNGVNDEPTVSVVPDQSIMRDSTTGALSFTISDPETSAAALAASTESSNTTLVPSAGMVLSSSATSRTVTVTPALGGQGWLQMLDDAVQNHAHLNWLQVQWPAYNGARGETHPAVGNVDGDPRAEIAVGLGPYALIGGWVQMFEDALAGYSHLSWVQTSWRAYTLSGGPTFPAIGRFQ